MLFQHWGATRDEIEGSVVGDDLLRDAGLIMTRSIDLPSPPRHVWPWLAQMGWGRAGWYSYDWIDNLGRRSARRIHPEWQDIAAGARVPAGPVAFRATIVDAPRAFVLELRQPGRVGRRIGFTLAYELRPAPFGTRLVTRVRARLDLPLGGLLERLLLAPGDGLMVRRQLLNLQQRASVHGGDGRLPTDG